MPQMPPSSLAQDGWPQANGLEDQQLRRWLERKGLRRSTLERAGVTYDDRRLWFEYLQLDGGRCRRYVDLGAFDRGGQDKWWVPGAKARGATWWLPGGNLRLQALRHKSVLLCEGETDALAAMQHRAPFTYIAAVPGAATVCQELADKLVSLRLQVTLAFDNDPAGRTATDRMAWFFAERRPLERLILPDGADLRDRIGMVDFRYERESAVQVPIMTPAPPLPSHRASSQPNKPRRDDEKPDLQRVWDVLSPRSRPLRKDGQGRTMRQAWCPLHDDGQKPAAWVGEDRWGCFVCGIESADVYELVAWVRGIAPPGHTLSGDAFLKARQEAKDLV